MEKENTKNMLRNKFKNIFKNLLKNKIKNNFKKLFLLVKENKIYTLCFLIIITSIISIIIQYFQKQYIIKVNNNELEKKDNMIAAYITGEIKSPGVYYLKENTRIENLIDLAGGLTENADVNNINPSKKIIDSDKIVIPSKRKEIIFDDEENSQESNNENIVEEKNCVDINRATKEELMTISGIGTSTADKIIKERENGLFEDIEDIQRVSGIGDKKYEDIKEKICVN